MQQVIIAGGRDFTDTNVMVKVLNQLITSGDLIEPFEISCGMAQGADITAYNLAKENNLIVHEYPADWKNIDVPNAVVKYNRYGAYNAIAGHMRNSEMANDSCTLVAFWDNKSRGTKDMIDKMNALGKTVYVFDYQGNLLKY